MLKLVLQNLINIKPHKHHSFSQAFEFLYVIQICTILNIKTYNDLFPKNFCDYIVIKKKKYILIVGLSIFHNYVYYFFMHITKFLKGLN